MSGKISILFPDKNLDFKKLSDVAVHDIGMDSIVCKVTTKVSEQTYIMNVMRLICDDVKNARFRSDVFEDILNNKKMRDDIVEILDKINFLREFGSFKHDHDHEPQVWDLLHRLSELDDYIKSIEAVTVCLKDADIHSEGLLSLKAFVEKLYNDNGFGELKADVADLRATTQNLKSVTLGVNLNERFEACGIGIVSLNNKPFTKSGIVGRFADKISGKDNVKDGNDWDGDYKFEEFKAQSPYVNNTIPVIPPLSPMALMSIKYISESDDQIRSVTNYMDDITERMLSKTVKKLRDVLSKYTTLTITDITDLMPEFIYYIRWAEYIEKLQGRGLVFCKPDAIEPLDSAGALSLDAKGVYNMKLVLDESAKREGIVPNDISFDKDRTLYILTGANRGGKTTITQAVGQLFFMAQGGIYVAGKEFRYVPTDTILTHFPADEDKTLDLGRLGEECKRFKELYEEATDKSILLLNETFSTTSFEEGYYIARDCSKAILKKGIRTIYNTHMHKLAMDIGEINEGADKAKAASLIVVSEEGKRSYEVKVAPPVGLSYAGDIAEKYGVTYGQLVEE
ncbi:DNA mismatch repair protein [Butyrivibrio sp. CB08]|uniref:MutS-related protein n=1 Tax=Butyrivibrio sp. CB08 TaxID=2364879 RepID=UPI000EA944F3|nr:DNA mismatch repair protein [Butyrivibrio sp. CB08]RKM61223.1 DNA mismatch repair protein [Butyrivibrio sp. CB08]